MKDIRSSLLLMLSVGLVGTWIYHLYDKTQYSQQRHEIYIRDSAAVADGIKDSLQKIYSVTLSGLDLQLSETRSDADSLKTALYSKLGEIYKLKTNIGAILKNRNATRQDLETARLMIKELQQKVDELRNENTSMEEEKLRLTGILDQLNEDIKSLEQNARKLNEENKVLAEKVKLANVFVASSIRFYAVTLKNQKEQETNQAKKATKFILSFNAQNHATENNSADMYIVVTQPDGKVLKFSVWDIGTFDSRHEGKKDYTMKVHFGYEKGELKSLLYSLNAESYEPGTYLLQIYHNGIRIGQSTATLH